MQAPPGGLVSSILAGSSPATRATLKFEQEVNSCLKPLLGASALQTERDHRGGSTSAVGVQRDVPCEAAGQILRITVVSARGLRPADARQSLRDFGELHSVEGGPESLSVGVPLRHLHVTPCCLQESLGSVLHVPPERAPNRLQNKEPP
eukprot:4545662-Amphidinium_carterae.1